MRTFFLNLGMIAAACTLMVSCNCGKSAPVDPGQAAIDNIMARKSVRSFTGEKISESQMETILKAAMAAPTAMNIQPWSFVVVEDEAILSELFGDNPTVKSASAVVVVCGQTTASHGTPDGGTVEEYNQFWYEDCAAATENLLLAVEALGLGAVWNACYPAEGRVAQVSAALGLPANVSPFSLVPVGVPAGEDQPKDKWKPERVHHDRW